MSIHRRQVENIFNVAIALDVEGSSYLDSACGENFDLRERVW